MTRRVYNIFFALTVLLMLAMTAICFCVYSKVPTNADQNAQLRFSQLNYNAIQDGSILNTRI